MLLDIVNVVAKDDYKLILTFENNEVKEFDCKSILKDKPYNKITDINIFRQVRIENGTIVWLNDVDIAPETLYLDSKAL